MSDIFISYSRKDSAQAEQLAELLGSAGFSCWIDKSGIDLATSWSGEITQAINECKAFVVLLSSSSIVSTNVGKEVSLASERRKKILPLNLEPVTLPNDLAYHLAGIQRAQMTNIDAVIRALGKLGLEAASAPSIKLVKDTDSRKSLMILPFEDLSPTADNQWFADGIVSELINALTNVKSLRTLDAQTTKEFRTFEGHIATYASEMSIRYFVQGDVRKFGDQIKISVRLLDIETGDHLWQDSLKGTMDDIFDIQEQVAAKVVEGLKIHLTQEEKSKLDERGTENSEAYEYFLRAAELFDLNTREGYSQAISLYDLASELDPNFADAMLQKAVAMIELFKYYDHDSTMLVKIEELLHKVEEMKPGEWRVHELLAQLYLLLGRTEDAEREHQAHIRTSDGSAPCQGQLGYFCFQTKQYSKAFEYYEASIKLDLTTHVQLWNVIVCAEKSGNNEGLNRWSEKAISAFQKQLRLHPDDTITRFRLASTFFRSNPSRRNESLREINILESLPALDSNIQYRAALLLAQQGEYDRALESLRKAISKGYVNLGNIRDADSPFAPLHGHPEFEATMKEVEGKNNG